MVEEFASVGYDGGVGGGLSQKFRPSRRQKLAAACPCTRTRLNHMHPRGVNEALL